MKKNIGFYISFWVFGILIFAQAAGSGLYWLIFQINEKGKARYEQKDYDGAIKYLSFGWLKNSDPEILHKLGHAYEAKEDYSKAAEFYNKAIKLGLDGKCESFELDDSSAAAMKLAKMYYNGLIGATPDGPDFTRSMDLFKKSHILGESSDESAEAFYWIGNLYCKRLGTNKESDYNMAIKYYTLALNFILDRHDLSQKIRTVLIEIYLQQKVNKNGKPDYLKIANLYSKLHNGEEKRLKYLRMAMTENNSADAAYLLGNKLKLRSEKITCYRFAMERGHLDGTMALAEIYKDQEQLDAAAACYQKAIDAGNVDAMLKMAVLYRMGYKCLKDGKVDQAQVLKYFQLASEHGNGFATFMLGLAQEYGSFERALFYWYNNELKGSERRLRSLAKVLGREIAVKKTNEQKCREKIGSADFKKAADLYQKAMDQGSEHAKLALAMLYWRGDYGCLQNNTPDYGKAFELFKSGHGGLKNGSTFMFPNNAVSFFIGSKYVYTYKSSDIRKWVRENCYKLEKANNGAIFMALGYFCHYNDKKHADALVYYQKAIDLKNEEAVIYYGCLKYPWTNEKSRKEGQQYFWKAMEDGYSEAVMAYIYYCANVKCRNDRFVLQHLKKLSERNHIAALFKLAEYSDNFDDKIKYYQKAEDLGNISASNALANLYFSSENGKQPDYAKALVHLKKIIADKEYNPGHAYSRLALMYVNGNGVKKDPAAAWDCFLKAGYNNRFPKELIAFLDELEKRGE